MKNVLGIPVMLSCVGCGAVEIPDEQYYRLVLPSQPPAAPAGETQRPRLGVIRVAGLDLAATLSGDRLLVAAQPVQLRAYEFHRWVAPLPRMLADELVTGLRRAGAFSEVKTVLDGPGEDLRLSGRILDCHQIGAEGAWQAQMRLELRLRRSRDEHLLFQDEFAATLELADGEPSTLVRALSQALQRIVDDLVRRTHQSQVQAQPGK